MTHIYEARIRAAKRAPILNDLRSLYYDDIGVPMQELRRLENDPNYIASPNTLVKVLNYYHDYVLLSQVCRSCPITICTENLINTSKSFDYHIPNSKSRFLRRFKKIKKTLLQNKKDKTIFYYARLKFSLIMNRFISRDYVSNMTSVPYKKLTRIENTYFELDNIEDAAILLNFYGYFEFGATICSICPVHSLYKNKNFKNIEKKEE